MTDKEHSTTSGSTKKAFMQVTSLCKLLAKLSRQFIRFEVRSITMSRQ